MVSNCPIDPRNLKMTHYFKFVDMTSLPWKPWYEQQQQQQQQDDEKNKSSSSYNNFSILYMYAMAGTILFTVLVFLLERILDERQAQAYQKTEFPSDLLLTVSKIDSTKVVAAAVATTTTSSSSSEKKEDENTTNNKKMNTDQPLLPQLQEKFLKAQAYGMDKIQFGMIVSTYSLLESSIFLILGYLPYMWDLSLQLGKQYMNWNYKQDEIKITLIFLAITTILSTFTSLPFEWYSTFYIEKKHGFNKQTYRLFIMDKIKSILLTFIIGGPFISLLLVIIQWGGTYFYFYVWIFMFLFSIIMMTLVPIFIMPLFNKYEPLADGILKERIFELAKQLSYPLTKLFVMDGSKRSSHSNAFMFGFGNNKRIVLFDTLMTQVDPDEILAILGHELGHWKLGHTLMNFAVTQIYVGCAFYCFSSCYTSTDLYRAFGFIIMENDHHHPIPTIIALILFFSTLWAPIDKILSFILTVVSRQNEFAADRFSFHLGMSQKLQTGLCKISLENLGAMCPDPWYATYHYSHPPLVERLSALRSLDNKMK